MKLHIRLGLFVSFLILIISTSIGIFSINSSYRNQLAILDKNISDVINKVSKSQENPLSLSTYLADESSLNFSLAYITPDLDFISLYEGEYQINNLARNDILNNSTKEAITVDQVRYRTYEFSKGDYLLFYFPLFDTNQARDTNIIYLVIFTILITSAAILISFWMFKKDSELNSVANSLKKNQERMKEFIGDASHELKTPLTIIKGYFELLEKSKYDSNKIQTYNSRIQSEIVRMQEIINNLLLIAELDDPLTQEPTVANISELLEKYVVDLKNLHPDRQVKIKIDKNIFVQTSEYYLDQLLSNLFSNLVRYTPANSIVEIELERKSKKVILILEDAGTGLPDYFYSSGIQAFNRFDKSRSRESGGSGLGMTIIHKIVANHKGSIKLDKSKYGGLKTIIELPEV